MLKIKDFVDLKELEKFGFEYSPKERNYKQYYVCKKQPDGWGYEIDVCIVTCEDRKIFAPQSLELDLIFDLIQAGLVEKVSD